MAIIRPLLPPASLAPLREQGGGGGVNGLSAMTSPQRKINRNRMEIKSIIII